MHTYDPQISWFEREIFYWCTHCLSHRLQLSMFLVAFSSVESPATNSNTEILLEYQDHKKDFSMTKASGLPSYRFSDCAIELTAGAMLPHNCVCPLLVKEIQAMDQSIPETRIHSFFHISSASRIFRCGQKKEGLALIIDD